MKVQNGHNVQVHYKGTLSDGTVFDESRVRNKTLDFRVGSGQMLKGFNDAVVGMKKGDIRNVTLSPEDAYGFHDPGALQSVDKQFFGVVITPLDTHLMSAIIGLYFGGSLVKK